MTGNWGRRFDNWFHFGGFWFRSNNGNGGGFGFSFGLGFRFRFKLGFFGGGFLSARYPSSFFSFGLFRGGGFGGQTIGSGFIGRGDGVGFAAKIQSKTCLFG